MVLTIFSGCTQKAYLSDIASPELFEFKHDLEPEVFKGNPSFLVYGDNRPSWRVLERFIKKHNWANKKMLIFPIYVPWLFLNGTIGSINFIRSSPDFGHTERFEVLNQIYSEIQRGNVDFIAHTGDMVTNGEYAWQWEKFLKEIAHDIPILQEVPIFPAAGNHDSPNEENFGKKNFESVFPNSKFYVKKFKDVLLIFLDSTILLDSKGHIKPEAEQDNLFRKYLISDENSDTTSWLEDVFSSATAKHKIVIMHHPIFSFGGHAYDWLNKKWATDAIGKRNKLIELFKANYVQAVFAGHEHYYEHSILTFGENENKMHFIVTGGGGTPLRSLPSIESVNNKSAFEERLGYSINLANRAVAYNYCLVNVDKDGIKIIVKSVEDGNIESSEILDEFFIE